MSHAGKRIGLALSGGGVRAAAFHLGVLRKLNELGVLPKVDAISTVSGGSIAGALYVLMQGDFSRFQDALVRGLRKSIERRILLNWRTFGVVLPNYSLTNVKAAVYDDMFFGGITLASLPKSPQLLINATNLATGKNWKFSQEFMGDWKMGLGGLTTTTRLANAVAASTAVPGIFGPLYLRTTDVFPRPLLDIGWLPLCDGGVYDNQGTHALLSTTGEARPCDYIICSDAAFPFDHSPKKLAGGRLNVLRRQSDVMMARIRNLQFQRLLYGDYAQRTRTAYFAIDWSVEDTLVRFGKQEEMATKLGIHAPLERFEPWTGKAQPILTALGFVDGKPPYLQPDDVRRAATIGTRLRALSEGEINMLVHHGATLCELQVRIYMPEILRPEVAQEVAT